MKIKFLTVYSFLIYVVTCAERKIRNIATGDFPHFFIKRHFQKTTVKTLNVYTFNELHTKQSTQTINEY